MNSLKEAEILDLWRQGLTKHKVATIYQRRYNQQIKIIRSNVVNRHAGRYISYRDALAVVEQVIYQFIQKQKK